jgi:hypothetical protein
MNSVVPLLAEASPSQISATMVLIVLVLVTVFIIYRRKPDEEVEVPPIVTFECESCGEVLDADDAPCPMCGGRVLRIETRPEEWQPRGDASR